MILDLNEASSKLSNGGVVAFPTETVYGLGARADLEHVINRVYKIKQRPKDNPMICHFADINDIYNHIQYVPSYFKKLSTTFSPGPLSYRLKIKPTSTLKPSCAGQDSVVCRVPDHDLARQLIELVGSPLVGPSANTSGKVSNTAAWMVEDDLGNLIDGVLDGGISGVGLESTIIDCTDDSKIRILRPGFITKEDLILALGEEFKDVEVIDFEHDKILDVVPGLKYKHYTPNTNFIKISKIEHLPDNSEIVLVAFIEDILELTEHFLSNGNKNLSYVVLGTMHNLSDAAQSLYSNIKFIDLKNPDNKKIAYLYLPQTSETHINQSGLGKAILNRLNRACA